MLVDAKRLFDVAAVTYDAERRKLVPHFDEFYGAVLELLPAGRRQRLRLLDLGGGTGLLAALVGQAFPHAHLTLIDFSSEMLARARTRFDRRRAVSLITADYSVAGLGGPYEAVVSALSIHHLTDSAKKRLFRRVYQSLVPGGIFVNADQVLGPTPALEVRYQRAWVETVKQQGATTKEVAGALNRMKADRSASLQDQIRWLMQAGFQDVDCSYKCHRFAVMSGTKPRS